MIPKGSILIGLLCSHIKPFGGWNCDHVHIARPINSNFRSLLSPKSKTPPFCLIQAQRVRGLQVGVYPCWGSERNRKKYCLLNLWNSYEIKMWHHLRTSPLTDCMYDSADWFSWVWRKNTFFVVLHWGRLFTSLKHIISAEKLFLNGIILSSLFGSCVSIMLLIILHAEF